jgi:hypothetical protein
MKISENQLGVAVSLLMCVLLVGCSSGGSDYCVGFDFHLDGGSTSTPKTFWVTYTKADKSVEGVFSFPSDSIQGTLGCVRRPNDGVERDEVLVIWLQQSDTPGPGECLDFGSATCTPGPRSDEPTTSRTVTLSPDSVVKVDVTLP